MTINERITAFRSEMQKEGINAYIIPMADYHTSEYVGDFFKGVEYMSGFTGTNATVVVTEKECGLWTDGRYFIQAEREIKGSEVKLFKMEVEGYPTVEEYLEKELPENGVIGFDGRVQSIELAEKYAAIETKKKGKVKCEEDLLERVWEDRPEISHTKTWILDVKYAGKTAKEKLDEVRKLMKDQKCEGHILSSLYDIAWLLNLRADDVENVPVFLSYMYITKDGATLYIQDAAIDDDTVLYLKENGVSVSSYDAIYEDLKSIKEEAVLLDDKTVNYNLYHALPKNVSVLKAANPTNVLKTVKNETELKNTREAHIKDGVAVTKFIYWLKQNIGKIDIDELSAAEYLFERRKEQDGFLDLSFETICAYGPNAAMMHYSATPESFSKVEPEGFLLVDSGGHYLEGTTDITRTIVVGPLTDKMKEYFTVTLRSHIRLAAAKFLEGCIGQNLDILARGPVWDMGLDYRCGTGHGVGHILNVHEGPQAFRWRVIDEGKVWPLKPGMITTDEPGLYIEDEFGIRHENELICVLDEKTEYGQYLSFENITMAPLDLDAVIPEMLTEYEKKYLNAYHKKVYETLSPRLTEEERVWLKNATREI